MVERIALMQKPDTRERVRRTAIREITLPRKTEDFGPIIEWIRGD